MKMKIFYHRDHSTAKPQRKELTTKERKKHKERKGCGKKP